MIFREATKEDADIILSWRNDPRVFRNFRVAHAVERQEHLDWFEKSLESPFCIITIAEKLEPVGMIRLDQRAKDTSEVAIIVAPAHQGNGIGGQMLNFACEAFDDVLIAEIKTDNRASRRLFEKYGFKQVNHEPSYVWYRRDRK